MYQYRSLAVSLQMSSSIIIPKPNKTSYDSSKMFCLIVLLNTLEKPVKKVIGEKLQFHLISNNFIHSNQLEELKQQSTTDADIFLTHIIQLGWVQNLQMSTLVFDIAQFFPSLNHQLLLLILDKVGFDSKVSFFFSNYLIDRKI